MVGRGEFVDVLDHESQSRQASYWPRNESDEVALSGSRVLCSFLDELGVCSILFELVTMAPLCNWVVLEQL